MEAKELLPHQQRVIEEYGELGAKLINLRNFLDTGLFANLDEAEQERLKLQFHCMNAYHAVLMMRIKAF